MQAQLNSDKTEVIWFGSKANLAKLKSYDCRLSSYVVICNTRICSVTHHGAQHATAGQ